MARHRSHVRWSAVEVLGEIGDTEAIEPLIQALKDKDEDVRRNAVEALGKIGDTRAVEPLIQALEDKNADVRETAVEALGKIGDVRAAEETIDWVFRAGGLELKNKNELESWTKVISNLFSDYTALILRASSYFCEEHITSSPGAKYDTSDYGYDLQKPAKAIGELCGIRSQISNNILCRIAERKDIKVVVALQCRDYSYGTLSFDPLRQMAKKELERRGNPPYHPQAYLVKEAWKL